MKKSMLFTFLLLSFGLSASVFAKDISQTQSHYYLAQNNDSNLSQNNIIIPVIAQPIVTYYFVSQKTPVTRAQVRQELIDYQKQPKYLSYFTEGAS